jgi:hypothetical protein
MPKRRLVVNSDLVITETVATSYPVPEAEDKRTSIKPRSASAFFGSIRKDRISAAPPLRRSHRGEKRRDLAAQPLALLGELAGRGLLPLHRFEGRPSLPVDLGACLLSF